MNTSLRPSPARDVLDLVHALGKAEWGPLAGSEFRGARAVLDALACMMFDAHRGRAAEIVCTARQIQDRAAYSERWTRANLRRLEEIGLIEWKRGGIIDGSPRPSVLRIVKSVLCDWIEAARRRHDERMRRYIEETRRRLHTLVYKTIRPRLPRSDHAVAATSLPPYRGRTGRPARPDDPRKNPSTQRKDTTVSRITLDLKRTFPPDEFMPMICWHGSTEPRFCNRCRYEGWTSKQAADRAQAEQAKTRAASAARAKEEAEEQPTLYTAYMTEHYGPNPRKWARATLNDPEARRLARV